MTRQIIAFLTLTRSVFLTYTKAAHTIKSQAERIWRWWRQILLEPRGPLRPHPRCHCRNVAHHCTAQPLFQLRPGRLHGDGHLTYALWTLKLCVRWHFYVDWAHLVLHIICMKASSYVAWHTILYHFWFSTARAKHNKTCVNWLPLQSLTEMHLAYHKYVITTLAHNNPGTS